MNEDRDPLSEAFNQTGLGAAAGAPQAIPPKGGALARKMAALNVPDLTALSAHLGQIDLGAAAEAAAQMAEFDARHRQAVERMTQSAAEYRRAAKQMDSAARRVAPMTRYVRRKAEPTKRLYDPAQPAALPQSFTLQRRALVAMVKLPGGVEAMRTLLAAMCGVLEQMAERDARAEKRAVAAEERAVAAEAREQARAERGEQREQEMLKLTRIALVLAAVAAVSAIPTVAIVVEALVAAL